MGARHDVSCDKTLVRVYGEYPLGVEIQSFRSWPILDLVVKWRVASAFAPPVHFVDGK